MNNRAAFRIKILFIISITALFSLCINSKTNNKTFFRKLDDNDDKSFTIYSILVIIGYIVFIVFSLFAIAFINCTKGFNELIFRFLYLANNGYLVLNALTFLITGNGIFIISSGLSSLILSVGTIIYLFKKYKDFCNIFECEFLKDLFRIIPEIWGIYIDALDIVCECAKDENNYCLLFIFYFYKIIFIIGFSITTGVYFGFILILIIIWCIIKIIIESISFCVGSCEKKIAKKRLNQKIMKLIILILILILIIKNMMKQKMYKKRIKNQNWTIKAMKMKLIQEVIIMKK